MKTKFSDTNYNFVTLPIDLFLTVTFVSIISFYLLAFYSILGVYRLFLKKKKRKISILNKGEMNILILGVTPMKVIQKKGIDISIVYKLAHNPHCYFKNAYLYIFPGFESYKKELENKVIYTEIAPFIKFGKFYLDFLIFALNYSIYLFKMIGIIFKKKIDLIKVHDPHIQGLTGIVLQRFTARPCILFSGGDHDFCAKVLGEPGIGRVRSTILRKFVEWLVHINVCGVLSATKWGDELFIRKGTKPSRILPLRQEVNLNLFEDNGNAKELNTLGIDIRDRFLVVFVGRLNKEKYPADVIESAQYIIKDFPNVLYLFIGEGPEQEYLESLTDKLGLEKNVVFAGFRQNSEVAYYLKKANVVICPLSANSLIEAAAAGAPIVAYDVDWHSTFITNNESGILVKFRDVKALAKATIALFKNPPLGERLGEKAKKIAFEKYSPSVVQDVLLNSLIRAHKQYYKIID